MFFANFANAVMFCFLHVQLYTSRSHQLLQAKSNENMVKYCEYGKSVHVTFNKVLPGKRKSKLVYIITEYSLVILNKAHK